MGTWDSSTRSFDYADEPAYIMADKITEDSTSVDASPSNKVATGSITFYTIAAVAIGYGMYSGKRWPLYLGGAIAAGAALGLLKGGL